MTVATFNPPPANARGFSVSLEAFSRLLEEACISLPFLPTSLTLYNIEEPEGFAPI